MAFLIWLIIIIAIVWVEAKKQQQKNGTTRPNVPRTPHTWTNGLRTWQNRNQSRANGQQTNYSRPQQTTYSRPQQARTNGQRASKPNDILSRATANVRENDADMLEMQMTGTQMMADAHVLAGAIDISGTSELMREVNDLMVTGYQADLTFERDFVAEGVEMLNRFELPAEG